MEFNHFGLKCPFAHIYKKNHELPLNLSIRGVQNKCVVKNIIHDAYDRYLTQQQDKEIGQFCLPKPETSEFANPELLGLPDRTGKKQQIITSSHFNTLTCIKS